MSDAAVSGAIADTVATLRARLLSLADAHARGELDALAYEAARRDAERALSDAVVAAPSAAGPLSASSSARSSRPSGRLVATLVAVVLAVAAVGYAFTGSPMLAGLGTPPPPAPPVVADGDREAGLRQIAQMVDALAERLKSRPDDAEGWTMLGRSYAVLARYTEALPAYEHASALQPTDATLLADYADAVAAANEGRQNARSLALIDRALLADPNQPKALALAGTVAFDRGDYATAVTHWQKIADALPPDSDFHRQVVANIDEARRRGGLAAAAPKSGDAARPAVAAVAAAAQGKSAAPAPAPSPEALTGIVTLSPALAAQVAPDDTVFVLARPVGARMPLAVFRATVKDLPIAFTLDDSMAMTPTMKISGTQQVVVAARVSKSGNAITQPGDLTGESAPLKPGTRGIALEIGTTAPR